VSCHETISQREAGPNHGGQVGYHTGKRARNRRQEHRVSDRSKRVETDVNVYRLRIGALPGGAVVFAWDYPGSTLLRVRIVRGPADGEGATTPGVVAGDSGSAPPVEPPDGSGWQVVYDADTGSFRDRDVPAASRWRYAVFAQDGDGPWTLWRDEVVELP
jgi:hypothetical protein